MIVKILGKGCKNCELLEQTTKQALDELSMDYTIVKVKDINEIVDYGVMKTPGLVVDEKLMMQGKLPSVDEIKKLFKKS